MSRYDFMPCTHPQHVSIDDCRYAHRRMRTEAAMVRGLIRGLKAEGWLPVSVYDGGEHVDGTTETATMDTVFSVDESSITFEKNGRRHGVLVILGNGVDCIADYGMSPSETDGWNALMERLTMDLYEKHEGD